MSTASTLMIHASGAPVRRRIPAQREPAPLLGGPLVADTIRALVGAIDARDPLNASHSWRVTALAMQLGEALGLSRTDMALLQASALLHDVGKLEVPVDILTKPGALTEAEWRVIREHPAAGAAMVARFESLAGAAAIVRHHHERVDGRGYPDGLAGEEIPALSRLVAIVDAYEAMTADRVYRPAMDKRAACDLINSSLGSQFDTGMGLLFLSLQGLP